MGKVHERRMARSGPGWEADPIDSDFDAPCRQCGTFWPVEAMSLGEEGRTCPSCEADSELAVRTERFTHETVWAALLVDAPAVGLGVWLAAGVLSAHLLFAALIWATLCVGQAVRGWAEWRETGGRSALVATVAGTGSAAVALVGALVFLLA